MAELQILYPKNLEGQFLTWKSKPGNEEGTKDEFIKKRDELNQKLAQKKSVPMRVTNDNVLVPWSTADEANSATKDYMRSSDATE